MHAVEYAWLDRIRTTKLYAYRLPADMFEPFGEPEPYAFVSTTAVTPLGPPEHVDDLLALHDAPVSSCACCATYGGLWDAVVASTLRFSGIRMRNAAPRVRPAPPAIPSTSEPELPGRHGPRAVLG